MDTFNPSQMPNMQVQPETKSAGPLIAVIIILALIIVGGLYFLKARSDQNAYAPQPETGDTVTNDLKQQNSSDDLNSIEADLNAQTFDNLDQGAAAIQAELQAQ